MYFDQFHNASKWKKITTPSSTFGSDNHHTDDEKLILNITNAFKRTHMLQPVYMFISLVMFTDKLFS